MECYIQIYALKKQNDVNYQTKFNTHHCEASECGGLLRGASLPVLTIATFYQLFQRSSGGLRKKKSLATLLAVAKTFVAIVTKSTVCVPMLSFARVKRVWAHARTEIPRRIVHTVTHGFTSEQLPRPVVRHAVDVRRSGLIIGLNVCCNLENTEVKMWVLVCQCDVSKIALPCVGPQLCGQGVRLHTSDMTQWK